MLRIEREAVDEPSPALLWGLLGTGNAREILARIVPEDPLGLRARVSAQILAGARLLDAERVLLAAQAQCALEAAHWRGEPEPSAWLERCAEGALQAVLEQDRQRPPAAVESLRPFCEPLALDARALADACARFHRLALEERAAFVALVLESRPPDALARALGLSLAQLGSRARAGLLAFARVAEHTPLSPPRAADRRAPPEPRGTDWATSS